jgi:hypothetical protein
VHFTPLLKTYQCLPISLMVKVKILTVAWKDPCDLPLPVTSWFLVLPQPFPFLLYLGHHRPAWQLFLIPFAEGFFMQILICPIFFLTFNSLVECYLLNEALVHNYIYLYPTFSIASMESITFQYSVSFS